MAEVQQIERFVIPNWALKAALQAYWNKDTVQYAIDYPNILSVEVSSHGYVYVSAGTNEVKENHHALRISE